MIFVGIDPGAAGAIAMIGAEEPLVFDRQDPGGLFRLRTWATRGVEIHTALEKVSSMPKQGVASSFKFGVEVGVWMGRLEALQVPYDLVTPQMWQKEMFDSQAKRYKTKTAKAKSQMDIPHGSTGIVSPNVSGKAYWTFKRKVIDTKAMSLDRARRLFPQLAEQLARKKDDGRADALLLAEYCRRQYMGVPAEPTEQPEEITWDPLA